MTSQKIKSDLKNIPETLLITLWAKAVEQQQPHPILRDDKAAELLSHIDYDFSSFKKAKMSQVGCCIRSQLIDVEVQQFVAVHPDAVIIQLGAGLDTRYERLSLPQHIIWYELDLPESMHLRKQLLTETDNHIFIEESLFDEHWIERVKSHHRPVLIIIEGVLMYFTPSEVKAFFIKLCREFNEVTVLFDMLAFWLVRHSSQHDSLKKIQSDVDFKWSLLDTKEIETWHHKLHIEREYYMSKHDHKRFPFFFRCLYKMPYFFKRFNQRIIRLHLYDDTKVICS